MNEEKKYQNADWLMEQLEANNPHQEIAEACQVSRQTISYWVNKFNLTKPYQNKKWLNKQYTEKKKSLREIADECEVSHVTIRRWLIKHSIPLKDYKKRRRRRSVSAPYNKEREQKLKNALLRYFCSKYCEFGDGLAIRSTILKEAFYKFGENKGLKYFRTLYIQFPHELSKIGGLEIVYRTGKNHTMYRGVTLSKKGKKRFGLIPDVDKTKVTQANSWKLVSLKKTTDFFLELYQNELDEIHKLLNKELILEALEDIEEALDSLAQSSEPQVKTGLAIYLTSPLTQEAAAEICDTTDVSMRALYRRTKAECPHLRELRKRFEAKTFSVWDLYKLKGIIPKENPTPKVIKKPRHITHTCYICNGALTLPSGENTRKNKFAHPLCFKIQALLRSLSSKEGINVSRFLEMIIDELLKNPGISRADKYDVKEYRELLDLYQNIRKGQIGNHTQEVES